MALNRGYFPRNYHIYEIEPLDDDIIEQVKTKSNPNYAEYLTKKFIIKQIFTITREDLPFSAKPLYEINRQYNDRLHYYRLFDVARDKSLQQPRYSKAVTDIEEIDKRLLKLFSNGYTNEFKLYYTNGKLYCKFYVFNNKKEGKYISYYNSGELSQDIDFVNDLIHGKYILYKNSKLFAIKHYSQGKLNGDFCEYYPSGTIKYKWMNENDIRNGEFIEYYENLNEKARYNYINNLISGDYFEYWPNGNIKNKIEYKNGKRNGKHIHYDITGNIVNEMIYINDKKLICDLDS